MTKTHFLRIWSQEALGENQSNKMSKLDAAQMTIK